MKTFSIHIFLSQIQRLPVEEVQLLLEKYLNDIEKMPIVEANQIFNFIENKFGAVKYWQQTSFMEDIFTFKQLATKIPELSTYTFQEIENINKLHPTLQVELSYVLSDSEKINLLNNFSTKLDSIVVQDFVLALDGEDQKTMMLKYKDKILQTDYKLLLSFIATLNPENQILFLTQIKENIKELEEDCISSLVLGIHEENMDFFFNEYQDIINSLDDNHFVELLSMLSGSGVVAYSKHFKKKIKVIPADVLMYKLGMSIDDSALIYGIWKANSEKLLELSDTYFHLIISRLDDEQRLKSLEDFKARYNKMDLQELLDLVEFDNDEIKAKLFLEYSDKINELDDKIFIDYINENIMSTSLRNKIFLLYKNKICHLPDKDFIYFIKSYSEKNLKYSYRMDENNLTKEEMVNYLFSNYSDRLKSISLEYLPKLFSQSDSCLQHKYIEVLDENIRNLIREKTYISDFLNSVWGTSRKEILIKYKDEFKVLTAHDWYDLVCVLYGEFEYFEDLLLECDIDNLDFIDFEQVANSNSYRNLFFYFEKNIKNKMYNKYISILKSENPEKIMEEYENLMTKIVDEDKENVLIDYNCICFLVLLKVLLQENKINNKDDYYQMFKEIYMSKLLQRLEKENSANCNLIKESLFYRLVKGGISSTILIPIKTLKGLIFFNKNQTAIDDRENVNIYTPKEIEDFVENLTEEQVIGLNNKLFKQICSKLFENYKEDYPSKESVRNLALKLYLSVGFQNARKLVDLKVAFTRYEYIFNDIAIEKIKLDEKGEPIINKKLNNFMFGSNMSDENTNMNRLLQDKLPAFEKRFAEVYNDWETIYQNLNGDVTVSRILKWFEENKFLLHPDEYRLNSVLSEIGSNEEIVNKARQLYQDMRNRKFSTIPKIEGKYDEEYTYEMLDLDDPLGLVVGYITRCCFLINGLSKTALFHSAQSKDGRIFIVRKEGELIAQSWVWRNGNLVCFDNVETRGYHSSNTKNTLLEVYKKASENIIAVSSRTENTKEQIKLVTFGGGYSKISLPKEKVARENIRLPRVDDYIYTDATDEQFILAAKEKEELYYGDVKAMYQDRRKQPEQYVNLSSLDREEKSSLIKKIRSIDFSKTGNLRMIDFDNYCYATVAEDWYILLNNQGDVECMILENDNRAISELYDEIDTLEKKFRENNINQDAKAINKKILSLVKGSEK